MATKEQIDLATKMLGKACGVPERTSSLSPAEQDFADMVAGRSRPAPGSDHAMLVDLQRQQAEAQRPPGVVARAPSDELREVILDCLRTMKARGEL